MGNPTNTVGTWALAVAFGPQLVALIARSADAPSNGSGSATDPSSVAGAVWVLAMFGVVISVNLGILVHVHVLLELLKSVLSTMGEGIKPAIAVHMAGEVAPIRQHVARRQGIVRRKAMERV